MVGGRVKEKVKGLWLMPVEPPRDAARRRAVRHRRAVIAVALAALLSAVAPPELVDLLRAVSSAL